MNLQEFAKLAKGDKIENAFAGSQGEVTEVTTGGVRIRWGAAPTSPTYEYSVQSTAWFHWNKVDAPQPEPDA